MKKLIVFFALIMVIGCKGKTAEKKVISTNPNFNVELLFTVDSCKVYRFVDNGIYRYFTNCKGGTIFDDHYTNGKTHYTVEQNIPTN